MAGIYLSKCEPDFGRRDFHIGDRPLREVAGEFGVRPEDREPEAVGEAAPRRPLSVLVSVPEEEAKGTAFEAGYYRARITPHGAMRQCGVGLSEILGTSDDSNGVTSGAKSEVAALDEESVERS